MSALVEKKLFETVDKVAIAIKRLRELEPPEGYWLAFSGGKDSITIKRLADMAGVKYDAHYGVTTIDPPELVRFIREHHPDVKWERPEKPLLVAMIDAAFPPMRRGKWCCELYKEQGGHERIVVTGLRAAESTRRSKRRWFEDCYRDSTKHLLNVIFEWTNRDIWDFIRAERLPYCSLYDEGWKRIGCLFCPEASKLTRLMQVERYPRLARLFRRAMQRLIERRLERVARGERKRDGELLKPYTWETGDEMFEWWINDDHCHHEKQDPDQLSIFE